MTRFQNINNSRKAVLSSLVGEQIEVTIQSSQPTEINVTNAAGESVPDAQTGEVLRKKLFNTNAKSEVAMKNGFSKKANKSVAELAEVIKAELPKTDAQAELSEAQSAYLNATAFTFSILSNHALYNRLAKGMIITGVVVRIDSEKGSLLTLDPKTIAIKPATKLEAGVDEFAMALPDEGAKSAAPKSTAPVTAES